MFSGVTLTKLYSDKGHEIQAIHTTKFESLGFQKLIGLPDRLKNLQDTNRIGQISKFISMMYAEFFFSLTLYLYTQHFRVYVSSK